MQKDLKFSQGLGMVRVMSNEGGAEEIGHRNEEWGGEPGSNAPVCKEYEEEDSPL